jgi:hypothetical protein
MKNEKNKKLTKYKKIHFKYHFFLVEEMNFADKKVVEKPPVEKWIRPILLINYLFKI